MINQLIGTLLKTNRLITGGMFFFSAPGHMLPELDYLLRKILTDRALASRHPLVFLTPTPFSQVMAELMKKSGVDVLVDDKAFHVAREVQFFYPQLVTDVGIAHCKLIPPAGPRHVSYSSPLHLAWALTWEGLAAQWCDIYKAWNITPGRFPLRDALDQLPGDPEFMGLVRRKKYAVLQRKARVVNGTVRILDDAFFEPTLARLKDEGYDIMLGGREPMLDVYRRYGVYDYPSSKFVSPRNDFYLFRYAALGITSPSGAGFFCDTLGVPHCQYAPWTLQPHPGADTIMVPSRLRARATGKVLTFSEQVGAFKRCYRPEVGVDCFVSEWYEDVPPTADDLTAAVGELICAGKDRSEAARADELAIRELDSSGMWKTTASRMSSTFLAEHPEYVA